MRKLRKTIKSEQEKEAVELTRLEWEIMKVLWEMEPCTAGTVQEELHFSGSLEVFFETQYHTLWINHRSEMGKEGILSGFCVRFDFR